MLANPRVCLFFPGLPLTLNPGHLHSGPKKTGIQKNCQVRQVNKVPISLFSFKKERLNFLRTVKQFKNNTHTAYVHRTGRRKQSEIRSWFRSWRTRTTKSAFLNLCKNAFKRSSFANKRLLSRANQEGRFRTCSLFSMKFLFFVVTIFHTV